MTNTGRQTLHPKDKGWSWVIMIGAFCVNFFLVGYMRSFGLLFVAFQEKYGYSAGLVSMVTGAQNIAFCLVSVVVMNFCLGKISVRLCCIIGVILQTIAIAMSNTVADSTYLIFCLGLLFGIGQGFLRYPSLFILAEYFVKRRSLVIAFASCGSSVGSFAFPVITRTLLDRYGLQGAVLLIAGIMLHQMLFVIVFTPPSDYGFSEEPEISPSSSSSLPLDCDFSSPYLSKKAESEEEEEVVQSLLNGDCKERVQGGGEGGASEWGKYYDVDEKIESHDKGDCSSAFIVAGENGTVNNSAAIEHGDQRRVSLEHLKHDCYQRHRPSDNGDNCTVDETDNKMLPRIHDSQKSTTAISSPSPQEEKSLVSSPLSVPDVFRCIMFWALLPYLMGSSVGSGPPAIFIPPMVKERGLSGDTGAFFLTISSIMDVVGRIGSGIILQMGWMTPSRFAFVPQTIGCIIYTLTFALNDYTGLLIFSLIYGLIGSCFFATQTLIVIEVLSMKHLASAMGYYALASGLAMGLSFPIAGYLHDVTNNYSVSFTFFAANFLLALFSLVMVQVFKRREVKDQKTSEKNEESSKAATNNMIETEIE